MESNYSSIAANLSVFYDEYKYEMQYNKTSKIFRYIGNINIFKL